MDGPLMDSSSKPSSPVSLSSSTNDSKYTGTSLTVPASGGTLLAESKDDHDDDMSAADKIEALVRSQKRLLAEQSSLDTRRRALTSSARGLEARLMTIDRSRGNLMGRIEQGDVDIQSTTQARQSTASKSVHWTALSKTTHDKRDLVAADLARHRLDTDPVRAAALREDDEINTLNRQSTMVRKDQEAANRAFTLATTDYNRLSSGVAEQRKVLRKAEDDLAMIQRLRASNMPLPPLATIVGSPTGQSQHSKDSPGGGAGSFLRKLGGVGNALARGWQGVFGNDSSSSSSSVTSPPSSSNTITSAGPVAQQLPDDNKTNAINNTILGAASFPTNSPRLQPRAISGTAPVVSGMQARPHPPGTSSPGLRPMPAVPTNSPAIFAANAASSSTTTATSSPVSASQTLATMPFIELGGSSASSSLTPAPPSSIPPLSAAATISTSSPSSSFTASSLSSTTSISPSATASSATSSFSSSSSSSSLSISTMDTSSASSSDASSSSSTAPSSLTGSFSSSSSSISISTSTSTSDSKTPHELFLEQRIAAAQTRLSQLVHALQASSDTLAVARTGVARANDELVKIQARLTALKKAEAKAAMIKNKQIVDELDRELKRLESELLTIGDNESRMHALVASLDRKLVKLRSDRVTHEHALNQLSLDKAALAKQLVEIQTGLRTLDSRMSDIGNQLDALKTQVGLLFAAESEAVAERRRARGRAPSVASRPLPGQTTQPVAAPVRALVGSMRKSSGQLTITNYLVMYEPDIIVPVGGITAAASSASRRDSNQENILGFCVDMADCLDVDLLEPIYDPSLPVLPGQKLVESLASLSESKSPASGTSAPFVPLTSPLALGGSFTTSSPVQGDSKRSFVDTTPITATEHAAIMAAAAASSASSSSLPPQADGRQLARFNSGIMDPDGSFGASSDDFVIVSNDTSTFDSDAITHSSTLALAEAAAAELAAVQAAIANSGASSTLGESSPARGSNATRRLKSSEVIVELQLKAGFRNRFATHVDMSQSNQSPVAAPANHHGSDAPPVVFYFIGERTAATVLVDWLRLSITIYEEQTVAERVKKQAAQAAAAAAAAAAEAASFAPGAVVPASIAASSAATPISIPTTAVTPRSRGYSQDQLDPKQAIFIKGRSEIAYFPELVQALKLSPTRFHMSRWHLVYSLQRDGASLQRFYDLIEHMPALVLFVQDDRGKRFGCFVAEPFRIEPSFYGSGETLVFHWNKAPSGSPASAPSGSPGGSTSLTSSSSAPAAVSSSASSSSSSSNSSSSSSSSSSSDRGELEHYTWSGANDWFMCSDRTQIAVGGGDHFAFRLDSSLAKGQSGPCSTFDSPTLASSQNFTCVSFEAWGPASSVI